MNKLSVYISTGQKQVLHTLWQESRGMTIDSSNDSFIKNLPADREKAEAEAKQYAKEIGYEYDGVYGSPRFKRAYHIEKYGVVFKHRRKKGKSFYWGYATPEFWENWKKNKEQIKEEGFSVAKYPEPRTRAMRNDEPLRLIWYVFYKLKNPGGVV